MNPRPPVPQTGALTRLRYAPNRLSCSPGVGPGQLRTAGVGNECRARGPIPSSCTTSPAVAEAATVRRCAPWRPGRQREIAHGVPPARSGVATAATSTRRQCAARRWLTRRSPPAVRPMPRLAPSQRPQVLSTLAGNEGLARRSALLAERSPPASAAPAAISWPSRGSRMFNGRSRSRSTPTGPARLKATSA